MICFIDLILCVREGEKIENEISLRKEKLERLKGAYSEILDKYLK